MSGPIVGVNLLRIRYLSLPILAVKLNGTLYVNSCSNKSYN